jgi:hypothetical protein
MLLRETEGRGIACDTELLVTALSLPWLFGTVKLEGMNALFFVRVIVFVITSIIACVMLPFLLVQYPLVGIVMIVGGIYWFSRSFATRKKIQ